MLDPFTESAISDAFKTWKAAAEAVFEAQDRNAAKSEIARLQSDADLLLEAAMKALRDAAASAEAARQ